MLAAIDELKETTVKLTHDPSPDCITFRMLHQSKVGVDTCHILLQIHHVYILDVVIDIIYQVLKIGDCSIADVDSSFLADHARELDAALTALKHNLLGMQGNAKFVF